MKRRKARDCLGVALIFVGVIVTWERFKELFILKKTCARPQTEIVDIIIKNDGEYITLRFEQDKFTYKLNWNQARKLVNAIKLNMDVVSGLAINDFVNTLKGEST